MENVVLRKGNLFNPLTQRIDNLLLDSDQYDLEITIDGKPKYYRVRYIDSSFKATEGKPKTFFIHRYNGRPINPEEAKSFTRTRFFREQFQDKSIFPKQIMIESTDYYASLQRKRGNRNINNSRVIYSFTLPSLGVRKKYDVNQYDIEVDLVNNRYYVIFIMEKVNDYGIQRKEPIYMIYEKKDFMAMKAKIDEAVLDIAIKEDYPLTLLEYVYITTGGDYKLIAEFFSLLETAKSIETLLENPLIIKIIGLNSDIKDELVKYLEGEKDDINYTYNNRKQ